jgi:CheY-like chemotaxis protein
MVRQSHGWVEVTSEPGQGATFALHFPAIPLHQRLAAGPAASGGPVAVPEPGRGRETVLVVEDEEPVRRIMSTVLRRNGYTVLEAATPVIALEVFDRNVEEIDLLLTDVVMPVMSGPALAQRLVAIRPALRVLFVSGYASVPPHEIHSPNVGFLSKPFQSAVLAARVREMLGRPSDPQAA